MCGTQPQYQGADGTKYGDRIPTLAALASHDAMRKARGEPTQMFHDVQPNYSNPEVKASQGQASRVNQAGSPTPTRQAKRGVDK